MCACLASLCLSCAGTSGDKKDMTYPIQFIILENVDFTGNEQWTTRYIEDVLDWIESYTDVEFTANVLTINSTIYGKPQKEVFEYAQQWKQVGVITVVVSGPSLDSVGISNVSNTNLAPLIVKPIVTGKP